MRNARWCAGLLLTAVATNPAFSLQKDKKKPAAQEARADIKPLRFDQTDVHWRADLAQTQDGGQQVELTVDLSRVGLLWDISNFSLIVEFFRGEKSIGTQTFEYPVQDPKAIQAVKNRKQPFKHKFPIDSKFAGADVKIKAKGLYTNANGIWLANQVPAYDPYHGIT